MAHLFVLDLTYVAGLDHVEQHLEAYRAYLATNYEAGHLLASGRKGPRAGGVILAQGRRSAIEQVIATDPFSVHGVAQYRVTEFVPTMTAPVLGDFRQ